MADTEEERRSLLLRAWAWLALLNFLAAVGVQGLVVSEVEVPRYLLVGQKAVLRCHYRLEGEVLYSLTWWKDGRQFYSYIPSNRPKVVVFEVPGVTVNVEASSEGKVVLVGVTGGSGGQYRCELVGEGPTFTTTFASANLSIINTPDGPPVIRGLKDQYHEGDLIRLTCTSYRSFPPPQLSWAIKEYEQIGPASSSRANLGSPQSSPHGEEGDGSEGKKSEDVQHYLVGREEVDKGSSDVEYQQKKQLSSKHKPGMTINALPSRVPFTYSSKFNRSSVGQKRNKDTVDDEVLPKQQKNLSAFPSNKFSNSFHFMEDHFNRFSQRNLKTLSFFERPLSERNRSYYKKRSFSGWKEVKTPHLSMLSDTLDQGDIDLDINSRGMPGSFYNSLDYPSFPTTYLSPQIPKPTMSTFTSSTTHSSTLQELTLPPQVLDPIKDLPPSKLTPYHQNSYHHHHHNKNEVKGQPHQRLHLQTQAPHVAVAVKGIEEGSHRVLAESGGSVSHYHMTESHQTFRKIESVFTIEQPALAEPGWTDQGRGEIGVEDAVPPPILYTTSLNLQLPATTRLARRGTLTLRCTASVHLFEWSTEVQVRIAQVHLDEPQHLPTLLNTGPAPNKVLHSGGGGRPCLCHLAEVLLVMALAPLLTALWKGFAALRPLSQQTDGKQTTRRSSENIGELDGPTKPSTRPSLEPPSLNHYFTKQQNINREEGEQQHAGDMRKQQTLERNILMT